MPQQMRPDTFIVGAPKSGTTSLYEYLAGHPDVFMSAVKEPGYFSPDVMEPHRQRYRFGVDEERYLALFEGAHDEHRLGEASTRYLVSHVAPGHILEFQPDPRIIVMLRNPVDFMHSFHNERVAQGEEDVTDFAAAIALDDERSAGRHLPEGSNALGGAYHERARFGEQLQRWRDTVGAERVLVIIFDDFTRDPATEFRRVLEFLGVDSSYQPESFAARNPSHRPRSGIVRSIVRSPAGRFVSKRLLPAVLSDNRAARITRRFRHSRINRQANPRPPIAPELRAELEQDMAPDVALLSKLLGRDMAAEWFGAGARNG